MRKLNGLLLFVTFFSFRYGAAQNDSLYLDLGRMKLRRDFTQAVTVKAKDLEKLSFTNLSDAVAAWFTGAYTNSSDVIYVIDGNVAGDVNMYSIRDIEEITLVQNALIQLNGASLLRQVLLVTTKKTGKPTGITVAGQSQAVFKKAPDRITGKLEKTGAAFFHRYYLAADKHGEKIQYGASVGYLSDGLSPSKDKRFAAVKPGNFHRLQGNAYIHAALGKNNEVTLQANHTPQYFDFNRKYLWHYDSANAYIEQADYRSRNTSLTTTANWQLRFLRKWTNSLNAAMNRFRSTQHDNEWHAFSDVDRNYHQRSRYQYYHLRNTLRYKGAFGNWQVEPTVSFSYLKGKQDFDWNSEELKQGVLLERAGAQMKVQQRFIQLTPAIDLSLPDKVNVTGGLLTDLNPKVHKRYFPFASATADVLQLNQQRSDASLKLFVSYAQFSEFTDPAYGFQQTDYTPASALVYTTSPMWSGTEKSWIYPADSVNRMLSAGSHLLLLQKRVNLQYNLEQRNSGVVIMQQMSTAPNSYMLIREPRILRSAIHRIGVLYEVLKKAEWKWVAGLNYTAAKIRLSEPVLHYDPHQLTGGVNNGQTGGWTNRLTHKNLQLGIDVLYLMNEKRAAPLPGTGVKKANSLLLQHCYLGYAFRAASPHPIKLYLNSRNAVRDANYRLNRDGRMFYGAGFEMKL